MDLRRNAQQRRGSAVSSRLSSWCVTSGDGSRAEARSAPIPSRSRELAFPSVLASAMAYWGVGTYFGNARSQNAQGHLLGHVYDLGATNPNLRSYATAVIRR
jgi:hypothetical protein